MHSILAVDDSASMRQMVSFTLKSAGFSVTEAGRFPCTNADSDCLALAVKGGGAGSVAGRLNGAVPDRAVRIRATGSGLRLR